MKLRIVGCPRLSTEHDVQQVIATYDAEKKLTTINCDVDIVTLGIAIEVLKDEYNKAVSNLETNKALQLNDSIRKVVDSWTK